MFTGQRAGWLTARAGEGAGEELLSRCEGSWGGEHIPEAKRQLHNRVSVRDTPELHTWRRLAMVTFMGCVFPFSKQDGGVCGVPGCGLHVQSLCP